ncbi:MAG: hypothetical protein KF763_15440 [Cyclobacteriaceae bacterium]|nr:hypothetical protein [Cyclobacteriaceae bacterium]
MNKTKEKVKDWFTRAGQAVANKLNHWINPLSLTTKKKGLIVIGLLTGMVCALLVIHAFYSKEVSPVLHVDTISTPGQRSSVAKPDVDSERTIRDKYNRMMHFKQLIDKLSSGDTCVRDSLLRTYPELADSLNTLLKKYY